MNKPIVELDLASMELSVNSLTDGRPTDIYVVEASKIFCAPEDQVTPEQRRYAKTVAYSLLYTQRP